MANTFSGIKLQLETLPVHLKFLGCYHCILLLSQTPSIAISGTCNQASYAHALSPVERVTSKTWLHDQEMIIFCVAKVVKSSNYVNNVFFGKEMNITCS